MMMIYMLEGMTFKTRHYNGILLRGFDVSPWLRNWQIYTYYKCFCKFQSGISCSSIKGSTYCLDFQRGIQSLVFHCAFNFFKVPYHFNVYCGWTTFKIPEMFVECCFTWARVTFLLSCSDVTVNVGLIN